jgi:hypothetical protein
VLQPSISDSSASSFGPVVEVGPLDVRAINRRPLGGADGYAPQPMRAITIPRTKWSFGFVETNYGVESVFVLHAYFTGAEEPYEIPKRALGCRLMRPRG